MHNHIKLSSCNQYYEMMKLFLLVSWNIHSVLVHKDFEITCDGGTALSAVKTLQITIKIVLTHKLC